MAPDPGYRTLGELCLLRARTHAGRPAMVDDVSTLTYAGLAARARSVAALLQSRGIGPGDRVAVHGPNTVDWAVAACGVLLSGASVMPVGHRIPDAERLRLFAGLSPSLRLVADDVVPTTGTQDPGVLTFGDLHRLDPGRGHNVQLPVVDATTEAVVMRSSGTSGRVKIVSMTHKQLVRLYSDVRSWLDLTAEDVWLGVVPLAHSFGFNGVLMNSMIAGSCVRFVPRYDRGRVAALLRTEPITVLAGPPTFYHDLAQDKKVAHTRSGLAIVGSTEVSAGEMQSLAARLGVRRMVAGYGMTETCGTVAMGELPARPDGPLPWMVPVPGIEVGICDGRGRAVTTGRRGRIMVRGYNVSPPLDADRRLEPDGWFDTGDIGKLDATGRLAVVGRHHDTVIVSGFNVYPREVETVLAGHPQVAAVSVVGVPDVRRGERLVACVVPADDDLDMEELASYAGQRLVGDKVPSEFVVTDQLPLTNTGKLSRAALRQMLGSRISDLGSRISDLGSRISDVDVAHRPGQLPKAQLPGTHRARLPRNRA